MGRVKELLLEGRGKWSNRIKADYFNWLCGIVGVDYDSHSFSFCIETLYELPFYSILGRDEDRGADGLELREEYAEETRLWADKTRPCSVLEMMIGLSRRMHDILEGTAEYEDRDYFWMLMENLTLTSCNDEEWDELNFERDVRDIVYILLERKYRRSGRGGLFPMKDTCRDQRRKEIWYQMHEWIQERFK